MNERERWCPALVVLTALFAVAFAVSASAKPCCGPITADGQRLAALLDGSRVESLWLPHLHVDWLTGEPDPARPGWSATATHCSAYAAAMAARMGVYLLRPPEHGQGLLANAQFRWLEGHGAESGWEEVPAKAAQRLANQGYLVVAAYENPDPHRSGHIAIVRPSEKSAASLNAHGPEETQAGMHNRLRTTIARGFSDHKGAWEANGTGAIRLFAHAVDWTRASP